MLLQLTPSPEPSYLPMTLAPMHMQVVETRQDASLLATVIVAWKAVSYIKSYIKWDLNFQSGGVVF